MGRRFYTKLHCEVLLAQLDAQAPHYQWGVYRHEEKGMTVRVLFPPNMVARMTLGDDGFDTVSHGSGIENLARTIVYRADEFFLGAGGPLPLPSFVLDPFPPDKED